MHSVYARQNVAAYCESCYGFYQAENEESDIWLLFIGANHIIAYFSYYSFVHYFFLIVTFFTFIYLFRGREEQRGGERERERKRERIPSGLHSVSAEPDKGLDPMNCEIMT